MQQGALGTQMQCLEVHMQKYAAPKHIAAAWSYESCMTVPTKLVCLSQCRWYCISLKPTLIMSSGTKHWALYLTRRQTWQARGRYKTGVILNAARGSKRGLAAPSKWSEGTGRGR